MIGLSGTLSLSSRSFPGLIFRFAFFSLALSAAAVAVLLTFVLVGDTFLTFLLGSLLGAFANESALNRVAACAIFLTFITWDNAKPANVVDTTSIISPLVDFATLRVAHTGRARTDAPRTRCNGISRPYTRFFRWGFRWTFTRENRRMLRWFSTRFPARLAGWLSTRFLAWLAGRFSGWTLTRAFRRPSRWLLAWLFGWSLTWAFGG
jgi:hypothetical protein